MIYLEDALPTVKFNGLNTNKAASFGSTLAVTGVVTFTGTPVFNGGITVPTVVQSALAGATVVLTASQSGGLFINRSTSGSPSWTLPTNAAGLEFTFYTASTTAGFTVTGGTIKAKTSATGTAVSGTTLTNTQATAVVGDCITLVADGTNWVGISQTGIFTAA